MMAFGGDIIISPSSSYPSYCTQSQFREFVGEKNFRSAIAILDQWLQNSTHASTTAFLLVEKAKILYADQQHIEAYEMFLTALKTLPRHSSAIISNAEKNAFDALFPSYATSVQSPEACSRLFEDAQALLDKHPEFLSLEHYIAASLANRGKFIEFFDRFFHVFQSRSDCFLSYKTMGVIHLRLFESSSSEERRETHRQEAVCCLKEAFTRQPNDSTLLVKLACILPFQEKVVLLQSVTADLMCLQTPIRRSVCFFLIQQAMDAGELGIAKQLLEKARSWYQYSRALHELSEQMQDIEKGKLALGN
jgi:tetratricopeptide (TPR) repeat protein